MRNTKVALWVFLCIQMLTLVTAPAEARLRPGGASVTNTRVALLVGNSTYPGLSLANPRNDVALVAKAACTAGFDTVVTEFDVDAMELKQALSDFKKKAAGAEVALVYFAGDGLWTNGRHWLRGSHAVEPVAQAKTTQSVEMAEVLDAVAGARVRLVALDACFLAEEGNLHLALPVTRRNDPTANTLILYAATPGKPVQDSAGEGTSNSPFAISFARVLSGRSPLVLIGDLVRIDVFRATRNMREPQIPFIAENFEGASMQPC